MDFIQHTIDWCKGEILTGKVILGFAVLAFIVSLLLKKVGNTSFSGAMVIPMLVIGLLLAGTGAYLIIANKNRIEVFQQEYAKDKIAFIKAEKERTASFIKGYPLTMMIAGIVVFIGLICYLFWGGTWGRTLGLTAIVLGSAILFIDHFSEERALLYYEHILNALNTNV